MKTKLKKNLPAQPEILKKENDIFEQEELARFLRKEGYHAERMNSLLGMDNETFERLFEENINVSKTKGIDLG